MHGDDLGAPAAMTIDALVHSNPTSPSMAHSTTTAPPRRRLRKPAIETYFAQGAGTAAAAPGRRDEGLWAQLGGGAGSKRFRDANDDGGRVDAAKRMY